MRTFMLLIMVLFAPAAYAVPATVERVMDGDTLRACYSDTCETVRVNNLNTPEKSVCRPGNERMSGCEPCRRGAQLGVIAASRARVMAPVGSSIDLDILGRDRYGRVIANVTLSDGSSWAERMIDDGLGAPYPCPNGRCGTRPRPWCPS